MRKGSSSWWAWASGSAFFLAGLFPLFNADAYGHLAQGRQIEELARVPKLDHFSFWRVEPQPWQNYEWAYDWLSWIAYAALGPNALILGKCLLLGTLGALLIGLSSRLGLRARLAAPFTLASLILALPVARFRFTVRPQILGLVFPAVLLLGISELYADGRSSRRKGWVLAGLAALHLIWVNTHGSHLLGVAITGVFAVMALRSAAFFWMLSLLAVQVGATACTPFGFAIAGDAIAHVLNPEYRELVVEWAAWSPTQPLRLLLGPVFASLFVLVALRPVARGSRYGLAYGVLCVVLSLMAFRSIRFVAHQMLYCAPFIGAGLARMPGLATRGRAALQAGLVGAAAAASLFWITRQQPELGFGLGEDRTGHPWASAAIVEEHVASARIVASIQDSWVLLFAAPSAKLLIDGRIPFHGPDMIRRVGEAFTAPVRFSAFLDEYDVNTVLIDHTRADHVPATEHLTSSTQWGLIFVENGHSLFARLDALIDLAPFRIVAPGYRTGGLLDPAFEDAEIRAEATRLSAKPNTTIMQAWHQGIELLRPLARDGDRAGIRKHATRGEQRMARASYARLSLAAQRFPGFTSIELYRSMAALAACDVPRAREALGRAAYGGATRGTSLAGIELSLRAGDQAERAAAWVKLRTLLANPQSQNDPWVRAIAADAGTRCP